MSPKIDNHAAGVCVNCAEQCPQRIIEANDEYARAQRLQKFRDEPHPEFFTRADHENREKQNDEIAFESEKIRDSLGEIYTLLIWRLHSA